MTNLSHKKNTRKANEEKRLKQNSVLISDEYFNTTEFISEVPTESFRY